MLDAQLLALLVCPATHQDVTLTQAPLVERLKQAVRDGEVRTVGGKDAEPTFDGLLLRRDGGVAYPVRDGIPVMLVEEALVVGHLDLRPDSADGSEVVRAIV